MSQIVVPIRGYGIALRELNGKDIPKLAELTAKSGFNFYAFPEAGSCKEEFKRAAEVFVKRAAELRNPILATGSRENYKLAVEVDGRFIGYVALDEISQARGEKRDLGYFIDPSEQGKGYATKASFLALDAFFKGTSYDEIYATVHPDNIPSIKVLKKVGYRIIGQTTLNVRGVLEPRILLVVTRQGFYDTKDAYDRILCTIERPRAMESRVASVSKSSDFKNESVR